MNGYDRYLENMFGWSGDFFNALFSAIAQADNYNLAQLSEGFPEEVDAYVLWTQVGTKAFARKVSPEHPLVKQLCRDYPEVAVVFDLPPTLVELDVQCDEDVWGNPLDVDIDGELP